MIDACTASVETTVEVSEATASGQWSDDFRKPPMLLAGIRRVGQLAGIVWALTMSPVMGISDPWHFERRRREDATVTWIVYSSVGRPITRAEALKIVQHILERAEEERIELAEAEALRGLQWEDEA